MSINLPIMFLGTFLLINFANSERLNDLSVILRLCEDGSCDLTPDQETSLNVKVYNKRLQTFVTGGVPQIMWDFLRDDLNTAKDRKLSLNKDCEASLLKTFESLDNGEAWAFKLFGSTGKPPETLFQSTLTSLGDYDTCLAIDQETMSGKYCLADMFPMKFQNRSNENFSLDKLTFFRGFAFNYGICLPSTCTDDEVRSILSKSLEPYLIKVNGDLTCDTQERISWSTRLKNLNSHQIISVIGISSIMLIVTLVTYFHVASLAIPELQPHVNTFVLSLSTFENFKRLISQSEKGTRQLLVDSLKLFTVVVAAAAHFTACIEIPISYFMINRHANIQAIFSSAKLQPFINENGLPTVAFLSGFSTFLAVFPLTRDGKMSYIMAIVLRYIYFLPSLLCVIGLEFIWTFVFSGPYYTRVANFILDKCSKFWWRNLLYMQNWTNVLEICGGHTFSTAVDFQLFALGMFAMFLLSKNRFLGFSFCSIASLAALVKIFINAKEHETTATLFIPYPIPIKIVEYLQYVHMATESYIPAYFMGFFVAYSYIKGFRIKLDKYSDHIAWAGAGTLLQNLPNILNGIYKEFGIIPQWLVPYQILFNRTIFAISLSVYFIYFLSLKKMFGLELEDITEFKKKPVEKDKKFEISIFAAMCRLSYAIFMSNYLLVKIEFFTSRSLLSADWFFLIKRILSSMVLTTLFALTFHLFFVAPFEQLYKNFLFPRKPAESEKKSD